MRFAVIALLGFVLSTEAIKLTKEEEEEEDHSKEVFEAREIGTGPLDKKYERVPPRLLPLRFSRPIRALRDLPSLTISVPTSREPGITSMSTRMVSSVLSPCQLS